MTHTKPIIQMHGITKRFGGVTALQNVDLSAYAGEVLAIVGDNGAGKSTLIKVLTGVYQPTEGHITFDSKPLAMASHADAIQNGIDAVYQNLALADHLTPAENLFLGSELVNKVFGIPFLANQKMKDVATSVLHDRLGVTLKAWTPQRRAYRAVNASDRDCARRAP